MGTNILPNGSPIADWFQSLKRSAFFTRQSWGSTFEFVERFCKWSKTAIILMFISAVALFILPLKFKIVHHRVELYLLCRLTKGLWNKVHGGVDMVGLWTFSGEHFYLCIIIDVEI
jgi:hypothetical protein